MSSSPESSAIEPEPLPERRPLVTLALLAGAAGVATGLVGGAFHWCLNHAADLRGSFLIWAHTLGWQGSLITMLGVAACTALAVLIVRFVPRAAGSGIQVIEAVSRGEAEAPRLNVLPAKFIGSLLALGSGLVLGREGPTVHMGAVLGAEAGRLGRRSTADITILQTSLAGAGLAVAFNAPIGGALFVLEEVTRSITLRTMIPLTIGISTAVTTSWLISGPGIDFTIEHVDAPHFTLLPMFCIFGILTGLLGTLYNRTVMGTLRTTDRLASIPGEVRAALIGLVIGAVLFIDPTLAAGGETLAESLLRGSTLALPLLIVALAVRFFLGPLSYATSAPGGLFAPLLTIGALWGAAFGAVTSWIYPNQQVIVPLVVIGMAAFFAATVRAPFTGAVLVIEMTSATTLAAPLIAAAGCAVLTVTLLRSEPIYDSLRKRMLASEGR